MKFNTQLTILIIASSIKAQQQNDNNFDIGNLINSKISALNSILPSDQVQSIATAVNNGIDQNRITGSPTTITANASADSSNAQVTQTGNSGTATDSSDIISPTSTDISAPTTTNYSDSNSAIPTNSSTITTTDNSNNNPSSSTDTSANTDDSDNYFTTPTDSSDLSTSTSSASSAASKSSSTINIQNSGSQIFATNKVKYIVSGIIFASIGSYLI